MERFEFIRMVSADFSIATLCELMEVSRTAYYRYLRGASYQTASATIEQLKAVEVVFWQHKRCFGQRRVLADLQELGYSVGWHWVRSQMQQQGLMAIQPRSFVPPTTDSRNGKCICNNLLLGQPLPTRTNLDG